MLVEGRDPQVSEGLLRLPHLDENESVADDNDEGGDEEVEDVHHLDDNRTLVLPDVFPERLQPAKESTQQT